MLNAFFKLVVIRPELLLAHVKSYADLVSEGVQNAIAIWKLCLFLYALSMAFFGFGVLSSIMSFLLWGALPLLNEQHAWVLIALPVLFFAASAFCYLFARKNKVDPLFSDIQAQLKLDIQAICTTPNK